MISSAMSEVSEASSYATVKEPKSRSELGLNSESSSEGTLVFNSAREDLSVSQSLNQISSISEDFSFTSPITDLDIEIQDVYQTETVDFPSSPHQLKALHKNLLVEDPLDSNNDECLQESYRAYLSPTSDGVRLKKVDLNPDDSLNSIRPDDFESGSDLEDYFEDYHSPDTFSNELMRRKSYRRRVQSTLYSTPKPNLSLSCHSEVVENSNDFTKDINTFVDNLLVDVEQSTTRKLQDIIDPTKGIDVYTLTGKLQDILTSHEIQELLHNGDKYKDLVSEELLTALSEKADGDNSYCDMDLSDEKSYKTVPLPADLSSHVQHNISNNFDDSPSHYKTPNGCILPGGDSGGLPGSDMSREGQTLESYFEETSSNPKSKSLKKITPPPLNLDDENLSADINSNFDDLFLESSLEQSFEIPERPTNLNSKKKISVAEALLSSNDDDFTMNDISESEAFTPTDAILTPDELEDSIMEKLDSVSPLEAKIPVMTAAEELAEERHWKSCVISGIERRIDMKVIEPYKKVLSHGGYVKLLDDSQNAIIVFSACYLPDRSRRDYDYVMDNLFLYCLTTLDHLVADNYVLIYLHGATLRSCVPSFVWLKRCYQMIDRRLRKNLKGLYLVHPTFWLKTLVLMTRPFISSKFSRKLRFISNLHELANVIPLDNVCIPERVKQLDFQLYIKELKREKRIW